MKTLPEHTLIYDQDCPMCRIYTGAFIRRKWLDEDGRKPYQQTDNCTYPQINMQRAQNEIALVNRKTGEVTYGLQSLITVVSHRHRWTEKLLGAGIIQWLLQHLYSFISYNRKVIAAVKPIGRNCNPSFNRSYRIAYLIVAWLLASFVFTCYIHLLTGHEYNVYIICMGCILFQRAIITANNRKKLFDYLGNMMTVFMMGALALLPALLLSYWLHDPFVFRVCFVIISGGMLAEHLRRVKLLGLNWVPTASLMAYFILIIIITSQTPF